MLTKDDIQLILEELSFELVSKFEDGRYKVVRKRSGYSDNPTISALQTKLSMMLQFARG